MKNFSAYPDPSWAGRWVCWSQKQKMQEENSSSWLSRRGSWCLISKYPGSYSVTTCALQGAEPPATSHIRLRLPLATFPAVLHEVWELSPINGCRGVPCQQQRQRVPRTPSLDSLHAEAGTRSYQTKPDLLRLRKAQSQGCSHSRHIFHSLVQLHGEMAGRGRWTLYCRCLFFRMLLILHRKAASLAERVIQHFLLIS